MLEKSKCVPSFYHRLHSQLCPTLCNPMDCSLPGSSVHGFLQARILQWVVISFSRVSSQLMIKATSPAAPALAGGFFYHWASLETPDHPQIMLLPPKVMDFIGYSWLYTPHLLNSNLQTLLLHKWTHGTSFLSIWFPIIIIYSVRISNVEISENRTYSVQHYRKSFFLIITFP